MTLARSLALFISGVVTATIAIVACGDDSPEDVDAHAACDCPAAEPPLAGRIIQRSGDSEVEGMGGESVGAGCETGETLLSGSCTVPDLPDVALVFSGIANGSSNAWACGWRNNGATPVTITATAICLQPAPE
jgi:hypothetical protein